jgi:hypothetical protein
MGRVPPQAGVRTTARAMSPDRAMGPDRVMGRRTTRQW